MRIAAIVLLLATAGVSASCQPQTTEAAISARLENQPLYLRGCWKGSTLNFDSSGHLKGQAHPEPFTLSGVDIERVNFKQNQMVLQGRRMGLEFERNMPKRVPLNSESSIWGRDVHITINIDAPADGDYSQALDAIFVNGLAALAPMVPDYWKDYATKHFLPPALPASPQSASGGDAPQASHAEQPKMGARKIGHGVTAPRLRHSVEPRYDSAARKLGYTGEVVVRLWVTPDGTVTNLSIAHPIGLGLDEQALAAISQYKFDPAMENGKPIKVELYIAVNFQL